MVTASVSHPFADESFQQLRIDLLLLLAVGTIETLDFAEPLHEVVRHCNSWAILKSLTKFSLGPSLINRSAFVVSAPLRFAHLYLIEPCHLFLQVIYLDCILRRESLPHQNGILPDLFLSIQQLLWASSACIHAYMSRTVI